MQQLVNQHPKSPYICLGAVNIVDKTFRRHIDGRPNVNILEFLSILIIKYFVNLAKPKSAILALLLCINTLATLRSR